MCSKDIIGVAPHSRGPGMARLQKDSSGISQVLNEVLVAEHNDLGDATQLHLRNSNFTGNLIGPRKCMLLGQRFGAKPRGSVDQIRGASKNLRLLAFSGTTEAQF